MPETHGSLPKWQLKSSSRSSSRHRSIRSNGIEWSSGGRLQEGMSANSPQVIRTCVCCAVRLLYTEMSIRRRGSDPRLFACAGGAMSQFFPPWSSLINKKKRKETMKNHSNFLIETAEKPMLKSISTLKLVQVADRTWGFRSRDDTSRQPDRSSSDRPRGFSSGYCNPFFLFSLHTPSQPP